MRDGFRRYADSRLAVYRVLPVLSAVIDITTTRTMTDYTHPPALILAMLALACSLLAGYGMAGSQARSWNHIIAFAAVPTIAVYVILDYAFPRTGFIRINKRPMGTPSFCATRKPCAARPATWGPSIAR